MPWLCVNVDLCVGAAVSGDGNGYNGNEEEEEEVETRERKVERRRGSLRETKAGRARDSQTERWFRSTRNTQR